MKTKVINRIRHFLLLRRQNDTVKLACLFALTGVTCLIFAGYHVWEIFRYMENPAEYILSGDAVVSNERVRELCQSEDISGVSRQIGVSVPVWYRGCETVVQCKMLSPDYIAELSDAEIPEGSSRIYMNEVAFDEFRAAVSEHAAYEDGFGSSEGGKGLTVRYSLGEDARRLAKLVVIQTGGEEAESFIYTPETEGKLLREAVSLRVLFQTHDLDGLHMENLRKLGYEIENEDVLLEEEYKIQMALLHIRYGLVICGICMAAVYGIVRSAKLQFNNTKCIQNRAD